jgi:hypothetical protein
MNEQAIRDAYDLFVKQGYGKSIDDFKQLIATNPDALNDSYNLFKSQGYNKPVDEYKSLMGVPTQQPISKKKVDMVSPSASGSLASQGQPEEKDYFENGFGDFLRGIDKYAPIGIGDYIDDMARSVAAGYRNGTAAEAADKLLLKGTKATPDQIQKFIDTQLDAEKLGPSAEMQDYQRTYEQEGKGFWGVVKGISKNPTMVPEIIASSLVGMATNTHALTAALGALNVGAAYGAATGAGVGAGIGTAFGGVGAAPAAVIGAETGAATGVMSAIPYAFGAASSVVEMGSTFAELLREDLGNKEFNKENVKAILEDPKKLNDIRNKAIARGIVIGTIDAYTGKLATGVGANILEKSALKSATGAITKRAIVGATAAGAGVEAAGGMLGETLGRSVAQQKMDVSEIALEGIAELPGGFRSTITAGLSKPSFKVNGERVSAAQIDNLINTMTPAQLAQTKIDIKNDFEGRKNKIQDKIVTHSIKENVRQANPELNEPSLNAITDLEKQLQKLEGNNTQTGKDKAAAIRAQIKNIQENQIQEEAKVATIEAEAPEIIAKRANRIAEVETILAQPDNGKGTVTIDDKLVARDELQTELETLKTEQDAIQKQATSQSMLRTGQPEVGLQQVVEGNQGLEVAPTGTQEVAPTQPQQEVDNRPIAERQAEAESKIKRKDLFLGVGEFSTELGGSDKEAVPVSHREVNGIELIEYAHPKTGSVDVIATGTGNNDFVGFYRIYENGKPTNKWSSKFENKSRNKDNFKTMISGVQSLLPEGHEYTEKTSISTDGLRVWNQQLNKGYELQYDENGNVVTSPVFINGDAIENELGVPVNKGNFDNIKVSTPEAFNKVKAALLPYLQKFNLGEQNIKWVNGQVKIDLPVLKKKVTAQVAPAAQITTTAQPTEEVSLKTQAPKFVRDISALITPATVRAFNPLTERIKKLSLNYDKLVKKYSKKKDPKVLAKIKEAEAQILNDAKQEIIDAVAQVDGVSVQFQDTKRGLWDKKFEPSFNMTLSISPQADTKKVSDLLFDFAEKYSQDAFILETDSEFENDVINKKREFPLTEIDGNNLMHYPQIIYTFDNPITDEQVADLSVALENEGVDAFNINNNEIKISVIRFLSEDEQNNLTKDEQYEERTRDFGSKAIAAAKATNDVLGSSGNGRSSVRIKKSSYQGATNEGSTDQTRQYDRSDVLKAFQESTTKVEELAVELSNLRQKEIDLQKEGKKLSAEEQARFNDLIKKVQPAIQRTFEANKKLYEDSKVEIEAIANDAIAEVDASISPFPIKRAERASVKTIRWYNAFTERLGDGSRVNIVVDTDANADKVFKIIDEKYPGDTETRRITETTDLGYPKRLIEIRTSNGTLAEIQVITNEAYLAKDGLRGFTGDEKQKATAKQKLDAVRARLGWNIPDGLGHYFYEIQRDTNVDDDLRDEAARLSDLYYDAFTNPKSNVTDSFMKDVMAFKEKVDAADKSEWDVGNNGTAPQSLVDYKPTQTTVVTEVEAEAFEPITAKDVKTESFTKDNALFYDEDERETDSGRMVPYLSSITIEATNVDGDTLGNITKLTDEDKMFSFNIEDIDGNEFEGFDTLGEAKQALADKYNKIKEKEFAKEAKKKAKAAEKKALKVKEVIETIDDILELDPEDKTTLKKSSDFLDKAIKDIDKFGKENTSFGIALPLIKKILQAVKLLVDAGVSLQEAIKRVSQDNNVKPKDVVDGIKAISQIAPIQAEYDALMGKVDALIARQKSRGIDDAKIVKNVDTFIRNSEAYDNANDAQKKVMEREGRNKMEAPERRAVSMGRVLGSLKDITNISRQDKLKVIKQIRDLSRDAAKDLANEINELAKSGKITVKQATNVIAKFGKVNMLNEVSVSNFVDYMSKVFADAEYVNKIEQAKSKLPTARKNVATKIGIASGLNLPLQRLFSINPILIPEASLDKYLELVNMFGERKAVLSLDEKSAVTKDVESILKGIDDEQSLANELADRFNEFEGKVFDDDGNLQYADTINKMVEEGVIDEKEAEVMRKYKSDIAPQVESTKMTEEELAKEKEDLLQDLSKIKVETSGLSTKDERSLANRLKSLISTSAVKKLSNTDLKNLMKVIDNINNNYLPHYAQLMVEKLNAINNANSLTSAIKNAVIAPISGLYSRVKSLFTKRTAIEEMIRRNPLFYTDQLFGNYKTKDIFNAVLNKAAEAEANFKAELKKVQNILEKAEEKIAASFSNNPDTTLISKFKIMTYMIQLEYDSNQGSKQVNPAADYLKATIKHIDEGKSAFGERDANKLQKILEKFAPNGEIDNAMLYNSFNQAEKDAIKDIRGINESLREKAEYTAAIIRGDRINPLTNYVHLNVLHENQPNDLTAGTAFISEYNDSMRPSTKAKSLIARTGKVSPLNFDVFVSAQRGAKFVLMDYNLTEPVRTTRKTINQTIANFEEEGRIPKEKRQIINGISSAFEEVIDDLLTNSFETTSIVDDAVDYINKQGYRAVLAGTSRFISELGSNIGFGVISDPKALMTGIEDRGVVMSIDAPTIMKNVKSKQTNRIFPTDTLSGKLIDTNILQQTSGIKSAKSKNPVANKIQQIWNLTGKKATNSVELIADSLISTPDKITMRPMWFGSFANEFKKLTGEDVDYDKIAADDEKYMEQYKDAIEKAKTIADERSVMVGATDNPFMGILKGTVKPNQRFMLKAYNNFNNFMTKFLIFEYVTARTAINAAMGNGSLTKKQGAAVLGAVTTRMVLYGLVTQMLGTGLMGLFFDDDEPEDEKSFLQKFGQQLTSAFTSLIFGRDFGNATKAIINKGLEGINENYLDFLREGDYDPYKDAIQYSIVPPEKKGRQTDLWDLFLNMGGAFGPTLKTADLIVRKYFEPEKKKPEAIARREKEINVRIPLEILGNAGFVPLYKDIRKAVMKDIYKDLEKADKNAADKKKVELEKLHGYDNQSDMKRYDPELWDKVYGPNAPEYNVEQAKKAIKKTKDSLEREMKDDMYQYTPKKKGGFGSDGFGSGNKKSKGGFGSDGFGKN